MPRYRFHRFIVSPRRRLVVRDGREQPLIPRYFDLLVFLLERRHEAVHRRAIFDRVWSDVIVSDSALSQAVRTLRRTLDDDSREPRFIRTVSRHGYRFVFPEVIEEDDDEAWPGTEEVASGDSGGTRASTREEERAAAPAAQETDVFEPILARLTAAATDRRDDDETREAAELLHGLGTSEALRRLGTRPGHAFARAILRDSRFAIPGAGPVPIAGGPDALQVAATLIGLRLRRAARIAAARWAGASIGGGVAGGAAGSAGAIMLAALPGSHATAALVPVLALVGSACGALGGAGVGAGLSMAEAVTRTWRTAALLCGGAAGGGTAGLVAQLLGGWSLAALVGLEVSIGGGLEGLLIGAAAGAGYAWSTADALGGLAAPRGARRARAAGVTATACGLAALGLTLAGRPLVGGTIDRIAQASQGAQASLSPLGTLVGEAGFGPLSRAIIGTGEGALFGLGLAVGLTRRPR
jgi:DNA-binding winged helix-turn-helix (wHTH) protein